MKRDLRLLRRSRYRRIMRMVLQFGVQLWWFDKTKRFRSDRSQAEKRSRIYAAQAKRFRETAMDMGGLIIKLGQHLSVRVDMLPKEYTDELSKLQDSVDPVDVGLIIERVERELGRPLADAFTQFSETPLAAASLAQVHEAVLPNGAKVAVKVLRPGIADVIDTDLETMRVVLGLLQRRTKIGRYLDTAVLYSEFAETIGNELDLEREGHSAETVQRNFLENMYIDIPKIYWSHTTHKVLTMELMEGTKINDIAALEQAGVDLELVSRNLLEIYLQMILKDGFFHADPHPGNVLVRNDGTIVLLDFGMMGSVTDAMRDGFVELITALFLKDPERTLAALQGLGFVRKGVDADILIKSLSVFLDHMIGKDPGATVAALGDNADELREFLYTQPFQLPSNVTFLGKALFTVIGLCMTLYPDIDLVEEVEPLAEDLLGDVFSDSGVAGFLDQAQDYIKTLLPALLKLPSLIDKAQSGRLTVRLASSQEQEFISSQQAGVQRIVRTIIGATLFFSGIYLFVHGGMEIISGVAIGVGALIMLFQARSPKTGRKRRRHPGR